MRKGGLSLKTKISYGMGDTGYALVGVMLSMVWVVFLTDVAGLRPAYAGFAVFFGRTWEYISTPIVGYLADRTNSRWGRYRPYLPFSAIPFGLTFAFLWWVPPLESEISLTVYYAAIYFVHVAATNLGVIPFVALTPTLSSDYDDRTSLTSFRMVFSIIGTLVAAVVPLAVIGVIDASKQNTVLYVGMAMAVASSMPLFVVFWGTEERIHVDKEHKPGPMESLKAAATNRPFILAASIYVFTVTALEIMTASTLYYLRYSIQIGEDAEILIGIMFVVAIGAIPAWNYVSQHLDKAKTYMLGGGLMVITRIAFAFLAPKTSLVYIYGLTAISGVGFAAIQTLPWAIVPDTVEYDEYATGKRREAIFYSLMFLFRSVAVSISLPMILVFMDLSGYVANTSVQTPAADRMIRFLFGGVPALFIIAAMLCAFFYPLTRDRFQEIQAVLEERKANDNQ